MNCFQNTNFSEDSQVRKALKTLSLVVNCFQNTNFSEDSQDTRHKHLVSCFLWCFLEIKKQTFSIGLDCARPDIFFLKKVRVVGWELPVQLLFDREKVPSYQIVYR